jgi:enoyl-CoA hydratase
MGHNQHQKAIKKPSQTRVVMAHRYKVREIAQQSGLSEATVDRVLNDRPGVRANTRAEVMQAITDLDKPVVCGLNGVAAGVGMSTALACDLVVATESAALTLAFTKVGLMPDGGATALVAASIGRARASAMALMGERLPASEAASAGLIYRTVPDDEFAAEVDRVVDRLARGASVAYRSTKQAIAAATLPHLDDALDRERDLQVQLFDTSDFAEGTTAFLAKRPPVFEGR